MVVNKRNVTRKLKYTLNYGKSVISATGEKTVYNRMCNYKPVTSFQGKIWGVKYGVEKIAVPLFQSCLTTPAVRWPTHTNKNFEIEYSNI